MHSASFTISHDSVGPGQTLVIMTSGGNGVSSVGMDVVEGPVSPCEPGDDNLPRGENSELLTDQIEEFLTGTRRPPPTDRVLATVMFTDIVNSTRLATQLGDQRWRTLLDRHDDLVRGALARFGGREVKTTGDGFLAAFDGPARAIAAAREIIDRVHHLGIEARAGIHTGECERRGMDLGGLAVHIGARVAALAKPSQVLVSSTVRDLTVGSGLQFDDRGEQTTERCARQLASPRPQNVTKLAAAFHGAGAG